MRRQGVDVVAGKPDVAGILPQRPGDAVHERTFAGTVGSDETDPLARLDREIDLGQRHEPIEALAQRSDLEQGSGRHDGTVERRARSPMMPFGASTTKPTRIAPTIRRLISDEIVTVAICCTVPSRTAPTNGPSQLGVPPIIDIAIAFTVNERLNAEDGSRTTA